MWPAYVWPQNGQESRESCRAAERFKFISPRKNLPFKEQMLPPLYQNHLFVFIALVSYLDASQPRLIWLWCSMEEVLKEIASNAGTLPIAYCRIAYSSVAYCLYFWLWCSMDEVLWEIGSNAAYCILPVAYCNGTWKKIRRKWQVMLPIAYFLLPIVMQHARSFGEMASNAAAKMTSKTAEQHRLCTPKKIKAIAIKAWFVVAAKLLVWCCWIFSLT